MTTVDANELPDTIPVANEFLRGALLADFLAVDTESNGEDVRDSRGYAVGVSLAYRLPSGGIAADYFPFRHRDTNEIDRGLLAELTYVLENHRCLIFHNAKYDLVSLSTLGIRVLGKFYCTMIMAHMINENWPSKSLDWLSESILGDKKKSDDVAEWAKIWGWASIPSYVMAPYAKHDAVLTIQLFQKLMIPWAKEDLDQLWEVEQQWVRLLNKMESRGVRIDKDVCRLQASVGRAIMEEIIEELGYSPSKPTDLSVLFFDILKLPIVKLTSGGKKGEPKPSFDKEAMAEYDAMLEKRNDPTAQLVLTYRGWQKAVTSNYEPYLELCSPDGRLRPNYKIHGTLTGRLSCEKPNLQQIPRVSDKAWNGAMKSAFIPKDGYVLLEADYSQLELRLGAAYANEEGLKQVFLEGRDIFSEMANTLGMARQDVKTMVYTIQYGGGINRLCNVFGITEAEAKKRRDAYYDQYPGFKRVSNAAAVKARSRGYLLLWSNRRRHFANPENEAHKAFNSVIQGGAAEIVKHTMLRLDREVDDNEKCRMLLQVHDSVVFEVREDLVDYYKVKIQEVMENVQPDFGVKFAVEVKVWGEK